MNLEAYKLRIQELEGQLGLARLDIANLRLELEAKKPKRRKKEGRAWPPPVFTCEFKGGEKVRFSTFRKDVTSCLDFAKQAYEVRRKSRKQWGGRHLTISPPPIVAWAFE